MTDTYLDGGGVLPDQPLPVGSWIRINSGAPNTAITIHADGDGIRITGHYLPVEVERVAPNELRVTCAPVGVSALYKRRECAKSSYRSFRS